MDLTEKREAYVDLTMPDPVTISVRVVDSHGDPLAGVDAMTVAGWWSGQPPTRTTTDDRGLFSWSGHVPYVESHLKFRHKGYVTTYSTPIAGEPGHVFPEERIVMYETSGIEGIAIAADGEPLVNAPLRLTVYYGVDDELTTEVLTDAAGNFVVADRIPATVANIVVTLNDQHNEILSWHTESIAFLPAQVTMLGEIMLAEKEDPAGG